MKRDKLYTVDKGLASVLQKHTGRKNLFYTGGDVAKWDRLASQAYGANYGDDGYTLDDYMNHKNSLGISGQNNPFSKGNIGGTSRTASGIIGAIPTGERRGMFDTLDPLHHLAGGRETGLGNAVGDAGVGLFQAGAQSGNGALMIAGAIAKGAGSLINAGWGIKENKENTAFIKQNTQQAQAAGNALAQSSTSGDFIANAGNMVGSSGFSARDLYKNGWFTNKGTRKGNALLRKENSALAMQGQGMMVGANNVDSNLDDNIFGNFRALGGPMEEINNHNMGAIEYGLMSDYLIAKNRQNDIKNKIGGISPMPMMNGFAEGGEIKIKHPGRLTALKKRTGKTEAELWAEGKPEVRKMITFARNSRKWSKAMGGALHKDGVTIPENVFCRGGKMLALGGDIQTNSADFSTGLTHIDAGGSHSENPYEGIQVGIDSEGTPNLVEENETIYNDYVYSNRIEADQETLKKFHLPKKAKLTYADITKRLEKEIKERPNDPISKAAFKAQMESLAEEQERQKKEMEAARAREAFEALSPEEQTTLMQQMAQQEAMAQQAAQEQAIAAEQQGTVNPEETMNMEASAEQMPTQPMEGQYAEEQPMMAYGGKVNKFAGTQSGSNQMRNAGTWKTGDSSANWNTYTRGGLRDYLQNIIDRIRMAPDDKTANEIRQEAIKTVAGIQQAYAKAYQNELTPVSESEAVRTLQSAFQNAGGNRYFGNISDNINLPVGHNTTDTEKGGWVDSLWGPRTSIRNWGSTEYGDSDYYKDIADLATQAGMVYAPNADWTYGDNTLYGLSIPEAEAAAAQVSDNTPDYTKWTTDDTPAAVKPQTAEPDAATTPEERKIVPVHRAEWPRYAGLFGPAAGLLMQGLGIGKPNTKALDGVIDAYDKRGAAIADYQPIGNYLRFRPMDIWAEQNRLNANARATDRAIANSGSNQGSKMAGLLANEYNNQIGSGQLYRQALEYNDALRERVAAFNRGTDQFNAEAYNRTALQNAEVRNRDRQYRAQLGMQAAMQKAAQDAAWNQGIYGNVAGLFKGIGDLGRENYQHNRIADMAATGIFGTIKPETFVSNGYLQYADEANKRKKKVSKGGRINKRKGGLTY